MRLDRFLFSEKYFPSGTKAAEAVKRGEIKVNGAVVTKPSCAVTETDKIEILRFSDNFVSNGGYKLDRAVKEFSLDFSEMICADIGASYGGFTDCLLKNGAKKVYAIDVGESLLSTDLKKDERVVVKDNLNARYLNCEMLGEKVDFAVCDVSFISLTYVLKPIYDVLKSGSYAVVLIKPQFECGKNKLNKNGIVTDVSVRADCVKKIYDFALSIGFKIENFTVAPIKADKNAEYLLYLRNFGEYSLDFDKIKNIVFAKGEK